MGKHENVRGIGQCEKNLGQYSSKDQFWLTWKPVDMSTILCHIKSLSFHTCYAATSFFFFFMRVWVNCEFSPSLLPQCRVANRRPPLVDLPVFPFLSLRSTRIGGRNAAPGQCSNWCRQRHRGLSATSWARPRELQQWMWMGSTLPNCCYEPHQNPSDTARTRASLRNLTGIRRGYNLSFILFMAITFSAVTMRAHYAQEIKHHNSPS